MYGDIVRGLPAVVGMLLYAKKKKKAVVVGDERVYCIMARFSVKICAGHRQLSANQLLRRRQKAGPNSLLVFLHSRQNTAKLCEVRRLQEQRSKQNTHANIIVLIVNGNYYKTGQR